jgi:hypothetical protein
MIGLPEVARHCVLKSDALTPPAVDTGPLPGLRPPIIPSLQAHLSVQTALVSKRLRQESAPFSARMEFWRGTAQDYLTMVEVVATPYHTPSLSDSGVNGTS